MVQGKRFSAREVALMLGLVAALAFAAGADGAVKRTVRIADGKKVKRTVTVYKNGALKVRQAGPVNTTVGNEVSARIAGTVDAKIADVVNTRITETVNAKIVDPVTASISGPIDANVSGMVTSIPGMVPNYFQVQGSRLGLGWVNLLTATGSERVAISELTFAGRGPVSDTAQEVLVEAFTRTSGTNDCTGPGTAGYERHTLRRILVKNQTSSNQITFQTPPLVLPSGGDQTCFGFSVVTVPSGSAMDVGATGFKF